MADAAVSAAVEIVLETVISLASKRIGTVLGFKEELGKLSRSAARIRGFLADAENKMLSAGVRDWLKQLEREVFKADNVVDEISYENLRHEVKYRNQLNKKVCIFFSFFSTIGFRCRLASKIRDINTNLERINREANELGLVFRYQIEAAFPAAGGATTSRQTDSIVVPNVVGRAKDESVMVETLLSPSERGLSVISIVGMGGLGKTTLAKSVYNNSRIDGHFGKKIWVCVAKQVDETMELFKLILESSTRQKVEVDHRDAIVQNIRQELKGERYFLVLDDVWNHELVLWNDFFTTLEGLNATKGSWCLITTRLERVAYTVSKHLKMNDDPYKLGKLSDDQCWSILKGKVVAGEEVPKELEEIKEQILRRCDGLPLAATLIGGLFLNKEKEEWRCIVQESLFNGDQSDIKGILKVSFDHLTPAIIKNCFAYCSIFPQDTKLKKDLVIELWMAEGFLQPDPKNEKLMEVIGDKYFRTLLQSSLLEKVEEGGRTHYKMHDLVHDFAKSVLNPESSNQDRYLALNSFEEMVEYATKKIPTSVRTLFLNSNISRDGNDILSKFKYLHALKLSVSEEHAELLLTSIGKLIHLRFLDLSDSGGVTLPKSICKLYNLQTLRLCNRPVWRDFQFDRPPFGLGNPIPKKTSNLISLRHLHYYNSNPWVQMPLEMSRLTCLQTLEFFNVGPEEGRGIEELGTLKDLKGSLSMTKLELVNGKEGAKLAKLSEKPNLSVLAFEWSSRDRKDDNCDQDVLDGLQPHPNLQGIKILNFMGDQFPQWLMNLSALMHLQLEDCRSCKKLPALGQLPALKSLFLTGLENIRSIGHSFYGIIEEEEEEGRGGGGGSGSRREFFPALESLKLEKMKNLVEWKDVDEVRSRTGEAQVDMFPMLKSLSIENCSQLITAPTASHFPRLERLVTYDCQVLLAKKILSSITTPSKLTLTGGQYLRLILKDGCGDRSNSEVECWGSLPAEVLEHLWNYATLRRLILEGLSEFPIINHLTSLEILRIQSCRGLSSIPVEMLKSCASLKELYVYNCPDLLSFPLDLQQTPSLELIRLLNCPKLTTLPKGFGFLPNFRDLSIGPLDYSAIDFDWSGLASSSSLTSLTLWGLSHLEHLPQQLQNLTTLTTLRLDEFGMEALPDWIGNLASLEKLELYGCTKLRYLPSHPAMRLLAKLISLRVSNCFLLKQRCTPQSGTDSEWSKISHIPECLWETAVPLVFPIEQTLCNDVSLSLRSKVLVPMLQDKVQMLLPIAIGDYTDFFCSIYNAKNCGTKFPGPENLINP